MLALVEAVKHDWFGVNLDTGNFHTADPYADLARLAPYAVNVQMKTEIQRAGKAKEEADLKRLVDMLRDGQLSRLRGAGVRGGGGPEDGGAALLRGAARVVFVMVSFSGEPKATA